MSSRLWYIGSDSVGLVAAELVWACKTRLCKRDLGQREDHKRRVVRLQFPGTSLDSWAWKSQVGQDRVTEPILTVAEVLSLKPPTPEDWVRGQQGKHFCQCGCGGQIKIIKAHYTKGIPQYKSEHRHMAVVRRRQQARAQGVFTVKDICKELGVSENTVRRWEGRLFPMAKRQGSTRVFTQEDLTRIKEAWRRWKPERGAEPGGR